MRGEAIKKRAIGGKCALAIAQAILLKLEH